METAIYARLALPLNQFAKPISGDKQVLCKGSYNHHGVMMSLGVTGGPGVKEKPIVKNPPSRDSDKRRKNQTPTPYKVLLHNDNFNKKEYVVRVLMKVIPGMTVDLAVDIMREAHENGMSVVITCTQSDAEEHCMRLRGNGLISSIEPGAGRC